MRDMKNLIREFVKEALCESAETIPAHMSPEEKELMSKYTRWGSKEKLGHMPPAKVKTKQVTAVLRKSGALSTAASQKKATQDLPGWLANLESKDYVAFFTLDPEDLAKKFEEEVLKV